MLHISNVLLTRNFPAVISKNCKNLLKPNIKMTSNLDRLISNNAECELFLNAVKEDIEQLTVLKKRKIQKLLEEENEKLIKQIEVAKKQLIELETLNGKKQIPIPGDKVAASEKVTTIESSPATSAKTEKKVKKEKPTAAPKVTVAAEEPPVDIGRLDLRIGQIVEVSKHPDADSLYVEKIECGEAKPRTVVSGLVKFVPIEEMANRMVVILCNLKPAKMRGVLSEAMVMCASTPEKVEVLTPPSNAVPGDLVHCDGFDRVPDAQLNPKKKVFETVAPFLKTNDELQACYKDGRLNVPGKGYIVAQTLKSVFVK